MALKRNSAELFTQGLEPESINDVLRIWEQKFIEKLRKSLDDNDRVSTGTLQSSIIGEIKLAPSYAQIKIKANKYWENVDEGRAAGKKAPPLSAMLEFIKNRGIKPKNLNKVKNKDLAYKSLAYVLAQGIKKKGIKPTNFVSDAITKQDIADFKKDIAKAFKKGLK